ncbi:MAG: CPBP family intramembrane metalloprotease [Clostridia bacterium]|nr:CPBP family intramembrane metalloprotease [Clostridia bacterium]
MKSIIEKRSLNVRGALIALIISVGIPCFLLNIFLLSGFISVEQQPFGIHLIKDLLLIFHWIVSFIVVYAVLRKQNLSFFDIGLKLNRTGIIHGIGILIFSELVILLFFLVFVLSVDILGLGFLIMELSSQSHLEASLSLWIVLLIILNSIFEELVIRTFFLYTFLNRFKAQLIVVFLSVIIQISYHTLLYGQEWLLYISLAISSFIYSMYYMKFKNSTALIIAHTIHNLFAYGV